MKINQNTQTSKEKKKELSCVFRVANWKKLKKNKTCFFIILYYVFIFSARKMSAFKSTIM